MTWNYAYTSYIWPSFFTVLLLIALGVFSWRRRSVPGALPFSIACLFSALWAAGWVLGIAAIEAETKITWYKFQLIWQLPSAIAITCFALEYAWPGRWLTRRNLALLSVPFLLALGLMLTPGLRHLMWRGFIVDGAVSPLRTPVGWVFIAYGYGLAVLNISVFVWLFIRSPQHRWPAVLMITGQLAGRLLHFLGTTPAHLPGLLFFLPPTTFEYLLYAIALFGFRIFDPNSLARQTVIAQMREGVLVLDPQGRVVSLNPAAERILGAPSGRLRGQPAKRLLPAYPDRQQNDTEDPEIELSLGEGPAIRHYTVEASILKDWRDLVIGRLLLLHDVTAQKQAQARLLEQERALAMLHEREQLARELHDSTGQVLGYVKLQAQAARDLLAQDQIAAADGSLAQLVAVAQEAHTDVREYILYAKTGAHTPPGFLPALQNYIQTCSEHYQLRAELIAPPDWSDSFLEPTVEAQLLRIIQEACTNIRKHAQAQEVQVRIQRTDSQIKVIIQDDGLGYDPELLANGKGQKYGLDFMRQRAEEVGGSVNIHSAPGQGTQVVVKVPVKETRRCGNTVIR
jgi:signal transduction histidine kinase